MTQSLWGFDINCYRNYIIRTRRVGLIHLWRHVELVDNKPRPPSVSSQLQTGEQSWGLDGAMWKLCEGEREADGLHAALLRETTISSIKADRAAVGPTRQRTHEDGDGWRQRSRSSSFLLRSSREQSVNSQEWAACSTAFSLTSCTPDSHHESSFKKTYLGYI